MVIIREVLEGSTADISGIRKGDQILCINVYDIDDAVDLIYHSQMNDVLDITIKRSNRKKNITIEIEDDEQLGITPEPFKIKTCANKCIFCFNDQLPDDLRSSLYIKDDDYRLSFLNGNFVTLTNVTEEELKKIVSMRLSPLYVSVHSTNHELRKVILCVKNIPDMMNQLRLMTSARITIHAQVVLVPGVNDKDELDRTISDLFSMYPEVASLAIVPVGLTKYRNNLYNVNAISSDYAFDLINHHYDLRRENIELRSFLFLADEFFLKAEYPIPPTEYYGDFPQIENGVGMIRRFLNVMNTHSVVKHTPSSDKREKIHLFSGESFAPIMKRHLVPRIKNFDAEIHSIINNFWGRSVTVGNLLTAGDISKELSSIPSGESVILPPRVVNEDWLFLDGPKLSDLSKNLGINIFIAPEEPEDLMSFIENLHNEKKSIES
jgi:putative radical SAM enzyme (TIGR03279 family)